MISSARRLFGRWRGMGRHGAIVPPMDGVLAPNQAIEEAPVLIESEMPDNLVLERHDILFSVGGAVMRLVPGGTRATAELVCAFDSHIGALVARDGVLAVGLEGGGVALRGGARDGTVIDEVEGRPILCPTALHFANTDTLLLALGSQQNPPSMWRHDLLGKNASGSVWRIDLNSAQARCLADGLAWPCGLLPADDGALVVSESWRNRLLALRPGQRPSTVLGDIAGYPGRLAAASHGGAWLSVFAPRSQLIEFVLREDDYRLAMMAEMEPQFWVAPALSPMRSFLEPMQLGGLKQLGTLKPWAPTRSYGLVIGLDRKHEPRASFHSRADGRRHGITSALEFDGRVLVTSKGGNAIIAIPLEATGGAK